MGPLLMTGLTCFGSAVAVGLVASSQARSRGPVEARAGRQLAIILIAFVTGSGILGVVIGVLAVMFGEVRDPGSGILAGAPAILGLVIGLAVLIRQAGDAERSTWTIGALYVVAIATLGLVVASLAVLISEIGRPPPPDWPFAVPGCRVGSRSGRDGAEWKRRTTRHSRDRRCRRERYRSASDLGLPPVPGRDRWLRSRSNLLRRHEPLNCSADFAATQPGRPVAATTALVSLSVRSASA